MALWERATKALGVNARLQRWLDKHPVRNAGLIAAISFVVGGLVAPRLGQFVLKLVETFEL